MFDCILVPLDGSAAAEAALTVAAQIPSDRVRLLAVASESTDLTTMCTAARDCQTYLEQIAKPLRRQGRKVRTGVALGDPVEQIVAAAAAADLIVMGSHGRGAAGRVVLGSVADWVARHASAPTLIVRSGPRPATALPPTRIVVPLDGSALAGQALATAGALAGSMRLPVHLVRVVDFDLVRAAVEAGPAAAAACARRQADLVRAAEAYLAGHAQALRDGDLDATSEVRVGPPVRELLAVIRESDLVVLATRGRGGIARWLLGSVAEQLVRHAAGPVLLVRAAGERPPTAAGRHRTPADDERVPTVQELFDLSGHVALVTGAGSGLGAVFAGALAEAGANVVCVGRRRERVEQTARRVREIGRQGLAIPADVTDDGAVADMVQQTVARFGRLDILVNNAGTAVVGPPEAISLADWQRVVDVNLTGVFLCAREAAKAMIAAGRGGRIINIASILGAVASEPVPAAAYDATKGAVVNLTRDLAVHWAPYGILVNAIGPAYFPSEMTEAFLALPEMRREIERRTPLGRIGRPEELKGAVVFFAAAASSYVTGQTLYVDGGWTAW